MKGQPMTASPPPPFDPAAAGWTLQPGGAFMQMVGPVWRKGAGRDLRMGLLPEAKHANHRGIVHGGMLMTLADYGLGWHMSECSGIHSSVTIQLDVQFNSGAMLGEFLEVQAEMTRQTAQLFFMRGLILAGERVVVSATGIWKAVKPLQE